MLAHPIEPVSEIDLERAQNALDRAKRRVESKAKEIDIPRALAALKRAENRIRVYNEIVASRSVEKIS